MRFKLLTLALSSAIAVVGLTGCDEGHVDGDEQVVIEKEVKSSVDKEVQTPLQKNYDTMDACKQEFSTDGDCTSTTIIVDNQPRTVFISPFFYPWGAIYHPWGVYSY